MMENLNDCYRIVCRLRADALLYNHVVILKASI